MKRFAVTAVSYHLGRVRQFSVEADNLWGAFIEARKELPDDVQLKELSVNEIAEN